MDFDPNDRKLKPEVLDFAMVMSAFLHPDFSAKDFEISNLSAPVEAFLQNVSRLRLLQDFPMDMVLFSTVYEKSTNASSLRDLSLESISRGDREPWRVWEESRAPWIYEGFPSPSRVGASVDAIDVAAFASVGNPSRTRIEQVRQFCCTLIIQTWTIFESLAEDLWVAALNSHPTGLAGLRGRPRSKYREKDIVRRIDPSQNSPKDSADLTISFNDLQRRHFNLTGIMGSIRKQDVNFRSIYGIRAAYHRAFSEQSNRIDETLDDPSLQYTAAIRNILIHKGGRVDQEYLDQVVNVPDAVCPDIGAPFPLTGRITAGLMKDVIRLSSELIRSVHAWIIGHPEKTNEQK
jgi:hypothetical protein